MQNTQIMKHLQTQHHTYINDEDDTQQFTDFHLLNTTSSTSNSMQMAVQKQQQKEVLNIMYDIDFIESLTDLQTTSLYYKTIVKLQKLSKLPFFDECINE